jgi:hypothetical protein
LCPKEGNGNHDGGEHHGDIDHEEEGRHNRRSYFYGNEEDQRYVVIDGQEACDEEGFRDRSVAKSLAVRDSVRRTRQGT